VKRGYKVRVQSTRGYLGPHGCAGNFDPACMACTLAGYEQAGLGFISDQEFSI
jgi:hypothetical protein